VLLNFRVENFPGPSSHQKSQGSLNESQNPHVTSFTQERGTADLGKGKPLGSGKRESQSPNKMKEYVERESITRQLRGTPEKANSGRFVVDDFRDEVKEEVGQGPGEENPEVLESRINDLIATLQSRKALEREAYMPGPEDQISTREYQEKRQLLNLEIEKNKELEQNLRMLEDQVNKGDKLYNELENR
jgi:hypothetical protein